VGLIGFPVKSKALFVTVSMNPAFGGSGAQGLSQGTDSCNKEILDDWAARIGGDT